jgi:rare lipoprotein A
MLCMLLGLTVLPTEAVSSSTGMASYYVMGSTTASGAPYHKNGLSAAHRTYKFGTKLRVTNLKNKKSVIVVVNDRGPFVKGRIIDLSLGAAKAIGMIGSGTARVQIEKLSR